MKPNRKTLLLPFFFLLTFLFSPSPVRWRTFVFNSAQAQKKAQSGSQKELPARRDLQKKLRRIYGKSKAQKGTLGIYIKLLDGPVIFARNSFRRFHPASCMKLLTAGAALRKLTPKFRFKTSLEGTLKDTTLETPLYIRGGGDPSLTHRDLTEMTRKLSQMGVKEIPKGIVVDDSHFVHRRFPPGFSRPSPKSYIAPTSAVSLNGNTVTVEINPDNDGGKCNAEVRVTPPSDHLIISSSVKCRKGKSWLRVAANRKGKKLKVIIRGSIQPDAPTITLRRRVLHPSIYAGETLKRILENEGIKVDGKVKRGTTPDNAKVLVNHESAPLQELITHMNRFSDNHYAEQILKATGAKTIGPPGSTKNGIEVIARFLERAGVKRSLYKLSNGSGLFANTSITPRDLVKFLQRVSTLDWLQEKLVESLALAGRSGTLARRMSSTRAEGRVRAKTGTLKVVSTLSGYVLDKKDNPVLVFSILHNDIKGSLTPFRSIQDEIVEELTAYVDEWR